MPEKLEINSQGSWCPPCGAKGRPASPAGACRLAVTALGSRLVACVRQSNLNGGLNPFCTARMEFLLNADGQDRGTQTTVRGNANV